MATLTAKAVPPAATLLVPDPGITLSVGDEVQALWKMGRKWYKTTVVRVNEGDGTYFLRYEDGDEWESVPADRIRLVDGTALVASAVEPMKLIPESGAGSGSGSRSGSGSGLGALSGAAAVDQQQVLRHAVVPQAVDPSYLDEVFPQIKAIFKPQVVKYSNTNPDIRKDDGSHGERIDWKVSSYMEVDTTTGGAMQKDVRPDPALLAVCTPLLERCNACFRSWYEQLHGAGSISELVRLQSFITRYRARPNENALLRHIDGAHVDGSIILALPTDHPFQGGGVTVWEKVAKKKAAAAGAAAAAGGGEGEAEGRSREGGGDDEERAAEAEPNVQGGGGGGGGAGGGEAPKEITYEYAMPPGDMCLLDNYVWHQGNPITAGERWSLVIFYGVKQASQHRILRIVKKAAEEKVRNSQKGP